MRDETRRSGDPLDENDSEEWLPSDDELFASAEEPERQWDHRPEMAVPEDSSTPEALEDLIEGPVGAAEEWAIHETDEVREVVLDEGTELGGLDADDLEAAFDAESELAEPEHFESAT